MESLTETKWDVVISGTGLQNSLLALALSRSDKKILHVDQNEYYGGAEAAFSLQEVDEWVDKINRDSSKTPFRNAHLWKPDAAPNESSKLSFSRAYTLTLSPQIVYTKSRLLSQLVSSKVYRQLEFQAVGNWWMYDGEGTIKRLPNGREDIFQDKAIDNRAKRSVMKFLKFVIDYENQTEIWEPHAGSGLAEFLSSQFQLPSKLQGVITALTLSLDSPEVTTVRWALPRIARHLTSIGVFGPGFGAVIPKWGGGAEIAQVACRASAVGGGVYILGTGVQDNQAVIDEESQRVAVTLSNGETVKTKHLVGAADTKSAPNARAVSKIIAVVSSPLASLFTSTVEGSPLAAVSVVVVPSKSLSANGITQPHPVYIMVHSSETGECAARQCVLYVTTLYSENSKAILEAALSSFLEKPENGEAKLLYNLYYEQQQEARSTGVELSDSSLDMAFNDEILEDVEQQWKTIMGDGSDEQSAFMQFEDRKGMNDDDEDADNDY